MKGEISMDRESIFKRYPDWMIQDIKKMAERVGSQAYTLVVAKYKISLEEVREIVKGDK